MLQLRELVRGMEVTVALRKRKWKGLDEYGVLSGKQLCSLSKWHWTKCSRWKILTETVCTENTSMECTVGRWDGLYCMAVNQHCHYWAKTGKHVTADWLENWTLLPIKRCWFGITIRQQPYWSLPKHINHHHRMTLQSHPVMEIDNRLKTMMKQLMLQQVLKHPVLQITVTTPIDSMMRPWGAAAPT